MYTRVPESSLKKDDVVNSIGSQMRAFSCKHAGHESCGRMQAACVKRADIATCACMTVQPAAASAISMITSVMRQAAPEVS
jgi:hypothetical protein